MASAFLAAVLPGPGTSQATLRWWRAFLNGIRQRVFWKKQRRQEGIRREIVTQVTLARNIAPILCRRTTNQTT
jgi:hypothetical protein